MASVNDVDTQDVLDAIMVAIKANADSSYRYAAGQGVTMEPSRALEAATAAKELAEAISALGLRVTAS